MKNIKYVREMLQKKKTLAPKKSHEGFKIYEDRTKKKSRSSEPLRHHWESTKQGTIGN